MRISLRVTACAIACAIAPLLSAPPLAAQDESSMRERALMRGCVPGIPQEEARGFVPLPSSDVFCPLIADPKGVSSFVSYLRGDAEDFATDVGSVGISDSFGFFRFGGSRRGNGVQLGLSGGVFAQFDLGTSSYDLINADYIIGFPLTMRKGGTSARLRVYHQSSHLGDEFLLRSEHIDRENLSFEALEAMLSQDVGPLRLYAGGEYFLNREPRTLPRKLAHGGIELHPGGALRLGTLGAVRLVAAGDVKVVSEAGDWDTGISARAGIEVGRARDGSTSSRRWSLLYEFFDGPSPYGQFFQNDVRLSGVGFHFAL